MGVFFSSVSFLQCIDSVGWVTGRASDLLPTSVING